MKPVVEYMGPNLINEDPGQKNKQITGYQDQI